MKEVVNTNLKDDGTLEIYVGNRLFAEIEDGRDDDEFVGDIIDSMGYEWMMDGTIRKKVEIVTRESIYDEMCKVLTNYENAEDGDKFTEYELYDMLVKIQNNWESVITVQEG